MAVLSIVLAVQRSTGSFATAGVASAGFGFANVVAAPWRARAIDRWGQARTLNPLGIVQCASYLALAVAAEVDATPGSTFIVLSTMAGFAAAPLGAAMRNVWTGITSPGDRRASALSLDATADEVVFITGPIIAASLSAIASPGLALLAAAIALLIGTLGMTTSALSKSQKGTTRQLSVDRGPRSIRCPGFARVLVVLFGVGIVLGTIEVVAPAVAIDDHHRGLSGVLLAALSVGSVIGGVIYGHVSWRSALGLRMTIAAVAMGVLTCSAAYLSSTAAFAAGAVVIGVFLAPSIVTGYLASDHLIPPHSATEGSVWTNTALNLGAAIANAAAGAVIVGVNTAAAMLLAGAVLITASIVTPRSYLQNSPIIDGPPPLA